MGKGLFTNDLFNGEALGQAPRHDTGSGIFRANLFDSQPLGQTTPPTTTPSEDTLFRDLASGSTGDRPYTPVAPGGGGKTGTPAYSPYGPAGGGKGGAAITAPYDPSGGAALPYMPAPASEIPWVPIALVGGAVVLTVAVVAMSAGRRPATATANKRRSRRNARRKHRRSR